ncbi:transglutaminase domain-containing protein [Novisyntrophococcus fermenticellae]|uniref:transglutaminase domain-containing protein n=1 Tax=Novisyntrophococcus fermenticellae TaxID=2068655 RepID=UPI001E4B6DCF|nr:transglutaminase domain-containing protein [Novisyntrophococcus fermenticellae]
MLNKKGTSESYAEAFAALGTQAGLACTCVTGEISSGEAHTWNYVKINGEWRVVDVAGNETESSGNIEKYLNLGLNDSRYKES